MHLAVGSLGFPGYARRLETDELMEINQLIKKSLQLGSVIKHISYYILGLVSLKLP